MKNVKILRNEKVNMYRVYTFGLRPLLYEMYVRIEYLPFIFLEINLLRCENMKNIEFLIFKILKG